jgi:hypothetical protein
VRYETRTERIGEALGPIDWDSPEFEKLGGGRGSAKFREMAEAHAAGKRVEVTTDGGWPRVGWHELIRCEMYDGWPFWRPVPSFQSMGPLGPEWHPFYAVTDWAERKPAAVRGQ